jgi:hypothetical protein
MQCLFAYYEIVVLTRNYYRKSEYLTRVVAG